MKNLFIVLAVLLANVGCLSAKTVKIGLSDDAKLAMIEFREGGPEGNELTPVKNGWNSEVTFESELWIHCMNANAYYFEVFTYSGGETKYKEINDMSCSYTLAELEGIDKISIELKVSRSVKANVSDPSAVVFRREDASGDPFELIQGENIFSLKETEDLYMEVTDPNQFKLTRFYNVADGKDYAVTDFRSARVSSWYISDGDEYGYTLVPASEFTVPRIRIRVDEPDHVDVKVGGNTIAGLQSGQWKEVDLPDFTSTFDVRNKDWGEDVYKTTLNGEPLESYYGRFSADVKDGDELDVTVYPEAVDYTLTLRVDPLECAPIIKSVNVDGTVSDYTTGQFTVRNGKKVKLAFDTEFYSLTAISVNGVGVDPEAVYNSYEYKVTNDTEIVISAKRNPVFSVMLDIDNPEGVRIRRNYEDVTVAAGENELLYTASGNRLQIDKKLGATYNYFAYEKDGEVTEVENPSDSWSLILDESYTKITIKVTPLVVDKTFVAYFDLDQEAMDKFHGSSYGYFSLYSSKAGGSSYDKMEPGYNIFNFADVYLPYYWSFSIYGGDDASKFTKGACYVDGDRIDPLYGTSWEISEINDGSVIKCYITKEPQTYSVNFTVDEDAEFSVVKDRIIEIEDLSQLLTDFEDTEIEIIPAQGKNVRVYVSDAVSTASETSVDTADGRKLEADERGVYVVRLDGNMNISVRKDVSVGVDLSDAEVPSHDVYSITGILIMRDATDDHIEALPAGVYIVGNKKFVKR